MSWNDFCKRNNISFNYENASFDTDKEIAPELLEFGKKWIEKPICLILHGDTGTGKTHFMLCLIREFLRTYHQSDLYYIRSTELDDRITKDTKEYFSCDYFVKEILSQILFLFIDDFGIEKDTDKTKREYLNFIDARSGPQLPTVMTTNLSLEEIAKKFGDRVASRLSHYFWIEFTGQDKRKENRYDFSSNVLDRLLVVQK